MVTDLVRDFGFLTLGTRMKRIGDRLQADAQRIVEHFDLSIPVAHYPYLAAIDRDGPSTIGDLAVALGVSQPGVTRTIALLERQGLVAVRTEKQDQRRRVVDLTETGRAAIAFSKEKIWPCIEAGVADLCRELSGPILQQLAAIEQGLTKASLEQRAWGDDKSTVPHPLDRPVWSTLTTNHARFSSGGRLARRFEPGYIPFVATGADDDESLRAAASLILPGETMFVVQRAPIGVLPDTETIAEASVVQMVCEQPIAPMAQDGIERLSAADAQEMLALATLTKPGPFSLLAGELGEFWGVRIDGRLAAMAGTRFVTGKFTELSGVCTHPDFQGRGLARRLSVFVARRFMDRSETPFLHAWETNRTAIGLYESIGFKLRAKLTARVVRGR